MRKDSGKARFSIKSKLLISYILVVMIPVMIGTYLPFSKTQKMVVKETEDSFRFSLNQMVEAIKYKMVKYNRISLKLSSDYQVMSLMSDDYRGRSYEASQQVLSLFNRFREEVDSNNEELLSVKIYKYNDTFASNGIHVFDAGDFANTDWYEGVTNNKGVLYWRDGTQKPFGKEQIKTLSILRLIRTTDKIGILELELKEAALFANIYNPENIKYAMIGIVDEQGRAISSNAQAGAFEANLENMARGFVQESESFLETIGGKQYLVVSEALNFQGWKIVAMISMESLNATTEQIKLFTLMTAVSCIIVFLLLTVVISDLMTVRIKKLTNHMRSVGKGEFDVVMTDKGNDEVAELSQGFNAMVANLRSLIEEVYLVRIARKEAEMRALQAQIKPHFLYNTLSSINWLAIQANAPKISRIVESLALFYRLTLSKGRETISIKDEMDLVRAYVEIQKTRYEDMFDVTFEVEQGIENTVILKFILQPFVENAIVHGMEEDKKGNIAIVAKKRGDGCILIRVIDNGRGMTAEMLGKIGKQAEGNSSGGYGVANVMERIRIHYGVKSEVSFFSEPGSGTVVEIVFPPEMPEDLPRKDRPEPAQEG